MKTIVKLYTLLIILSVTFQLFNSPNPNVVAQGNDGLTDGNLLKQKRNYTGAIAAYNKALEIDPKDKQVWANKGDALNLLGNYTGAIAAYNKALEIDPTYVNAWDGKGWALNE